MNDLSFMSLADQAREEHRLRILKENGRFYEQMKMLGVDVGYMFERHPIHSETFGLYWRKTAEEPPTRKDGDALGSVLAVGYHCNIRNGLWLVNMLGWGIIADNPEKYPLWMRLPRLPDLPTPEKRNMIGF